MRIYLVLLACALTAATAWPGSKRSEEIGWFVPQQNGQVAWMNAADADQALTTYASTIDQTVTFYLYTKSNPTTAHKLTYDSKSVEESHFEHKNPTKFVIHGWKGKYTDSMNKQITKAWLAHGDYNIIVVDWAGSRTENYVSAAKAVPEAGVNVGNMILHLHDDHDMSLDTLEVIGHSLGAHVAGYAGKTVGSGRVHAIVGLDPALPLFSWNKPEKRLSSTDAFYVESIQTNGGKLGFLKPIGKGTFYPNGGRKQPGCGDDLNGLCAHTRSVTYYVEAIERDNFGTVKCVDYEAAVNKECGSTFSSVRMGADTNAYMVDGDYYVPVHETAPYGMLKF